MIDDAAEALARRILVVFPASTARTRADVKRIQVPVGRLLDAELDRRADRIAALPDTGWIDRRSADLPPAAGAWREAVRTAAQFPPDAWEEAVANASRLALSHLVRPAETAAADAFADGAERLPVPAALARVRVFGAYGYLPEIAARYAERKGIADLDRAGLERLLRRIDRRMVEDFGPDEWVALAGPLYDLLGPVASPPDALGTGLLRALFEAKGRHEIASTLISDHYTREALHAHLTAVMPREAAPETPSPAPVAEPVGESMPVAETPPAPPSEPDPTGDDQRGLTGAAPTPIGSAQTESPAEPPAEAELPPADAEPVDTFEPELPHAPELDAIPPAAAESEVDTAAKVATPEMEATEAASLEAMPTEADTPEPVEPEAAAAPQPAPTLASTFEARPDEAAAPDGAGRDADAEPAPERPKTIADRFALPDEPLATELGDASRPESLEEPAEAAAETETAPEAKGPTETAPAEASPAEAAPTEASPAETAPAEAPTADELEPLWKRMLRASPGDVSPSQRAGAAAAMPPPAGDAAPTAPAPHDPSPPADDAPLWQRFAAPGTAAPEAGASETALGDEDGWAVEPTLAAAPATPLPSAPLPPPRTLADAFAVPEPDETTPEPEAPAAPADTLDDVDPPAETDPAASLDALETTVLGPGERERREWFVNALFDGSRDDYADTLRRLADAPDWTAATQIIASEVFRKHRVNIYSEASLAFTDAVETRMDARA